MNDAAQLSLTGVHGRGRSIQATAPGARLCGVSLELRAGVHSLLGTPADGTEVFAALAMGRVRPSTGTVRVAGADPSQSSATRARIAALAPFPELPALPRMADVMEAAGRAGGWDGRGRLTDFGLGALEQRGVLTASSAELRAVELAIALCHPEPALLLLFEPFRVGISPAYGDLKEQIRSRATAGSCVVVVASTPEDVLGWVDTATIVQSGFATAVPPQGTDTLAATSCQLEVWVAGDCAGGARALAAALANHAELSGVGWQAGPADEVSSMAPLEVVVVRAGDLEAAALLVAHHAHRLGTAIRSLHSPAPTLAEVALAAAQAGRLTAVREGLDRAGVAETSAGEARSDSSPEQEDGEDG